MIRPHLQNRALRPVIYPAGELNVALARRHLDYLRTLDPWDPYLNGYEDVAVARIWRQASRTDAALAAYRRAIGGRTPPRFWIEAGLFEMSFGDYDEGAAVVLRALSADPFLIREIESYTLRSQIRAMARRQSIDLR